MYLCGIIATGQSCSFLFGKKGSQINYQTHLIRKVQPLAINAASSEDPDWAPSTEIVSTSSELLHIFCLQFEKITYYSCYALICKIFFVKNMSFSRVRITLIRPLLYFDHFHIFDIFCTLTHRLYFDLFGQTLFRPMLDQ